MNPKVKKALKITGIIFALIAVSFIGLILYAASRPKSQPFDDSKLAVHRPNVHKTENGFVLFQKTVGKTFDPDKERKMMNDIQAFDDDTFRNLSLNDFMKLENKYGYMIRDIDKSSKYKYFIAPETRVTSLSEDPFETRYIIAVYLTRLNLAFAWYDFRNNNPEQGMQRLESILRIGMLLQNEYGELVPYFVGLGIQNRCFNEINNLLDNKLIPQDHFPRLIRIIRENNDYINGIRKSIRTEYNSTKNAKDLLIQDLGKEGNSSSINILLSFTYDELKTRKKFYDFWSQFYDWTGKSFKERPILNTDIRDDSFVDKINLFTSGNAFGEIIFWTAVPSFSRCMEKLSFYETQTNTLSVKIALHRYFNENNKSPETLDALVPEYIPAVPRDPFDGKPLRYNPNKKIIYSVGYNLKDDGGVASKYIFEIKRTKLQDQKDLVLHIINKTRT